MGFLIAQIGWAAIVGVSLLILLSPSQGLLMRKISSTRSVLAPLTDKRVSLITEVLTGVRVIKFFSWYVNTYCYYHDTNINI